MKKICFAVLAGVFLLMNWAFADEGGLKKLSISTKITYASRYMWRGMDLQNGDPAIQPQIFFDLAGTGPYLGIWGNYALDAQWHKWDEVDFYAGYYLTLWERKPYALDLDVSYTYYYFPMQKRIEDSHEVAMALKLSEVIPQTGRTKIVPYSTFYYSWSPKGNEYDTFWVKLGSECRVTVEALIPQQKEQTLIFYAETFHNDGYKTLEVTPGWSHIATGFKTTFQRHGIGFTPGLNYQRTFNDTVNKNRGVVWYTLQMSYNF